MAVLIGHASISEKGTIEGAKGDSTGKEVCTRTWYSKPWSYMAIHPDPDIRERHAQAVEAACANNMIGYGQSDRNTLNAQAKKVDYDLSKIKTKCNCDCSSLQNVAAVAAGAQGVIYGSNGWTTSSMRAALEKAGYKIITASTYLKSAVYCVRGAIYVKPGSHTVCGLNNGSKAAQTLKKAGASGSSSSGSGESRILKRGMTGEDVKDMQQGLIKAGYSCGSCGADGDFGANTEAALKSFQADHGLEVDGEYGPLSKAKLEGAGGSTGGKAEAAKSFDKSLAGTYIVNTKTDPLTLRAGAGTSKKRLTSMPKGAKVQCYGYYTKVGSVKWLYVIYDGVTGFASGEYLKKQ